MNILKIADGVTGLFPKKILVTVIDEVSGKAVASYKARKEDLPSAFDRPMVIELNGVAWRVVKAVYLSGKQLNLWVQEEAYFLTYNKRCMAPTLAPRPKVSGMLATNHPLLQIGFEEWKQIIFLSPETQEAVEEEMKLVEHIAGTGGLLGYETVHMRTDMNESILNISFSDFYHLVEGQEKGSLHLEGEGMIEGGFAVKTERYVYYGIAEDDWIRQLGLRWFEALDDEIMKVTEAWDLILVDWCARRII